MIGNPNRILKRPIPTFIWKAKYAAFEIENPESSGWLMKSSVAWDYPFIALEGTISDSKSKSIHKSFRWFVFGYTRYSMRLRCAEDNCRPMRLRDKEISWFRNTIRLIPNKYRIGEVAAVPYEWEIDRESGKVGLSKGNRHDTLYLNGLQPRSDGDGLAFSARNGGRLVLMGGRKSIHDADWGEGEPADEIRISAIDFEKYPYLVYFLKVGGVVYKCAAASSIVGPDKILIINHVMNLGNGAISTTPEKTEGSGADGSYLRGFINGKPIYETSIN